MSAQIIDSPLLLLNGLDGQPLTGGYVYLGEPNLDPITSPKAVYWDEDMAIPAQQPLRTNGGYISRNGAPARVWTDGNYSILVKDARGRQVFYLPFWSYASAANVMFLQAGDDAVLRTVQSKLRDIISVKDFGATGDGVTDDSLAIQAALDYAATLENAEVVFPPSSNYVCNSGLSIDLNRVMVDFQGSKLDFTGMTTGAAFTITQSNPDANHRNALNHAHPLVNGLFYGPGVAVTAVTALVIRDPDAPYVISGGTVRNCLFMNFAKDVEGGNGFFCWTFDKCNFTITYGTPTTYSLNFPAETNCGERNMFVGCMWNNRPLVFDNSNGSSSTFFHGCSIDGEGRFLTLSGGGATFLTGCHIEHFDDSAHWIHVSGTNTYCAVSHSELVTQSSIINFSPFYSDSTCSNGGVGLTDLYLGFGVNTMTAPLIAGTGMAKADRIVTSLDGPKPGEVSATLNYLAHGGFESANYAGEWDLTFGAVRSNAQARTGSWSLSFPATTLDNPRAVATMPMAPGQNAYGSYYYLVPAIAGTSGTFYVETNWLDKGGQSLGGVSQLVVTGNVGTWTRGTLNHQTPAPKGTVSFSVAFSVFGVAAGTPTAYVDDVTIQAV